MQRTALANAECFIRWQSADASHADWRYFPKLDFWRDIFPGDLGGKLEQGGPGVSTEVSLDAGALTSGLDVQAYQELPKRKLASIFKTHHLPGPFCGRFYPRGVLAGSSGFSGIFEQDRHPFRVSAMAEDGVTVDLNHPLAAYPVTVGGTLGGSLTVKEERGGQCNDLLADLSDQGPGMQCRPRGGTVELIHGQAFERVDPSSDAYFYESPRMVHHIDAQARAFINRMYRRFVSPGAVVLDLMSSWVSHLEGIAEPASVIGLGMNAEELARNDRLSDFTVADLNHEPHLPFQDNSFDVVVCSVSVEYLTQPVEVFVEVARVLRPGGRFIVTFSDRWFPPKVVRIWTELHPFERMGLVLEYFRRAGSFGDLATESYRGWLRPADDKYYPQRLMSDPVFAVWGQRQ